MTHEEFQITWKRLRRQLNQRADKVNRKVRPYQYFENKRLEFVEFINEALKTDWFEMPKETTTIYKLYHNIN